jgi:hypothetical protein
LPWVGLIAWAGCSSSDEPDARVNVKGPPGDNLLSDEEIATEGPSASADQQSCLGETHQAEVIGLDIFLMLDISSSMADPLPGATTLSRAQNKWDAVKQSLEAFVQSPESADIGVGLQYFPQQKEGVPLTCTTNAECGPGAPCTSSVCVRQLNQQGLGSFFVPAHLDCVGAACFCSSNADCTGPGESCREMNGQCVVSGDGFLPLAPPLLALCNAPADCARIPIPGIACEQQGVCENLINGQIGGCSPSIPCLPGGGRCGPLLQACLNETSCEAPTYAAPAVPISAGATRANDVLRSLEAVQLRGRTPTGPALSGALDQARSWALEHPDRQVITVLATDGFPTECTPQAIPDIAQVAGQANAGGNPVRTFVIGVFSAADLGANGQENLDVWARAGGSERAFVINTSGNVADDFLRALNQIRDTAINCQFQLAAEAALDFDRVNLRVNDPAAGVAEVSNVGDSSACGDDQGWYYVRDAAGTPTQIEVCPSTCARFMTAGISAELEVGCATRIR